MRKTRVAAQFKIKINRNLCIDCRKCVNGCGWSAIRYDDHNLIPENHKCVGCHYCVYSCPTGAISIEKNSLAFADHGHWTPYYIENVYRQAEQGGMLLAGTSNDRPVIDLWSHMIFDACQVTNPPIDPIREPMELRTYLGRKPDNIKVEKDKSGYKLQTELYPNLKLETPILFSAMSFGAVSLPVHQALVKAAKNMGTFMNCGEGGLHESLYPYSDQVIVQVASGRFGVDQKYLKNCAAIEIKIGQGAKPGIGGHLPGEKVGQEISKTRMIPEGTDAISPAPHHDIYSIEDLRQLIYALKETVGYKVPVGVKIATVNNVAAIASGVVRAGADILYLDGGQGGTGAAPTVIRNNMGMPIEIALAVVDDQLRKEGIRHQASIIAAGGFRDSGDVAKAIALGADAVSIGTAPLIAIGCHMCKKCYTGNCSWGIATQREDLVSRLDVDYAEEMLTNLVRAWSLEIKEMLGAMGLNSIESLRGNRERLRGIGLDQNTLNILGIKAAGN
ncbi:MAG: IMP dehydrogenase [Halanaerobiales bacterium]|nr:IMP dehydrogenase [Halanaerobiales bacterium]